MRFDAGYTYLPSNVTCGEPILPWHCLVKATLKSLFISVTSGKVTFLFLKEREDSQKFGLRYPCVTEVTKIKYFENSKFKKIMKFHICFLNYRKCSRKLQGEETLRDSCRICCAALAKPNPRTNSGSDHMPTY